jgi:hypothetical protein
MPRLLLCFRCRLGHFQHGIDYPVVRARHAIRKRGPWRPERDTGPKAKAGLARPLASRTESGSSTPAPVTATATASVRAQKRRHAPAR